MRAHLGRARLWQPLLIGLGLIAGLLLARPPAWVATDQEQPRLGQPAPLPQGAGVLVQSLQPVHNGLSAVELVAVAYGNGPAAGTLTVRLLDPAGALVAERAWSGLAHNQPLRLEFAPQPGSAGRTYRLELIGSADNQATAWAYPLDAYLPGALSHAGQAQTGDLRFTTSYTYLWPDVLRDAAAAWARLLPALAPLWLLLFAPGQVLLDLAGPRAPFFAGSWSRAGAALGLSVALLALAWLWLGAVGLPLSPALLAVLGLLAGFLVLGRRLADWRPAPAGRPLGRNADLARRAAPHALLAAILFASLTVRLLAVRDLALPPWVDSSHHFLIARVFDATGRVPAGYAPFLPVETFFYHWAVHALAVSVDWLTPLDLVDALLLGGQVLNGLMPLAVYTLAAELTGRPRAGLVAAALTGLVAYFPGYYLTWGRYSQLTGLLLLAPAIAALWRLARPGARPPNAPAVLLAGALAAGVLLAHYRVFLFFLAFAALALVFGGLRCAWRGLAAAGLVGAALALPWLARLLPQAVLPVLGQPQGLLTGASYNDFPLDYFRVPLERGWLLLALAALAWGLVVRQRVIMLVGAWTGLIFLALNAGPSNWLVNNNTWAISLFMPGAVLVGWGADRLLGAVKRIPTDDAGLAAASNVSRWASASSRLRRALPALVLPVLTGLAAFAVYRGAAAQVGILNPATVLAGPADREALAWVAANTPPDAKFLVNGWEWLNGLWAGSDGGAWLLPLANRQTTLPPVDYGYGDLAWQAQINTFNAAAASMQAAAPAERLAWLRAAGVTHVFIGARGGIWQPDLFATDPNYQLLFTNGAAWVFAVRP